MNILDNLKIFKNLDKSNMAGSVQELYLQLLQTKDELKDLKIPGYYRKINKIVVNGMGGSRLGARVASRLFEDKLRVPIIPIGSYTLPNYVDENTLLILASYSGNTEEILNTVSEGLQKTKKILVFSQNGKLTEIAKKNNLPGYYDFTPKHNPSNQPRMSIGYQILGIILLLSKCGLLTIKNNEIEILSKFIFKIRKENDLDVGFSKNKAKKISFKLNKKMPIFVAAEFLLGAIHVWRNQVHENAKQTALYFPIPELNHHLLEGLMFPKKNPQNLSFVFIKSNFYHNKNTTRINITQKVLSKYKIPFDEINLTGETKLEQVFELIQFGSFVGFYLSMLNKLDPTPIPWVDYFKKELKK
ncbi:SIS domain-containing protein [Patescibacteria group bacterium]